MARGSHERPTPASRSVAGAVRATSRPIVLLAAMLVAALVPAALVDASPSSAQPATTASEPRVSGPITTGKGSPSLLTTSFDLSAFGYVTEEYFLEGTATAFTSARELATDGKWKVATAAFAPYATRMVVVRPADPKQFNGTAVVEWLNVSAGFDSAPGWMLSHLVMLREGMAWVGVSAQAVGVQGGADTVGGLAAGGLKAADPARYGSLSHPGDSYSYDIFTQAGRAVRGEAGVRPLGALKVRRVLATGESQSATRMVTYVNAVHRRAEVFDGFLVHSRFGGGAPLSQAPLDDLAVPVGTVIRDDLDAPVLVFQTETDVGPLGSAAARQPDTRRVRTWEVAGTAHADAYTGAVGFGDDGRGAAERALLDVTNLSRGPLSCETPVNAGPQYAVLMAAVRALDRWVRAGTPPPRGDPLEVAPGPPTTLRGVSVPTFVIARDEYGNARGGIRTAFVDAPRAALTGELNTGGRFCSLFGTTTPLDAATLATLYPSGAAQFRAEFERATKRSVKAGFLLPEEADRQLAAIREVPYPG